jgi:protein-L-isoaspartate(D-aspartate) O-methyltransferase
MSGDTRDGRARARIACSLLPAAACALLVLGFSRAQCLYKEKAAAGYDEEHWAKLREKMVETQIEARGVKDKRVLEAMKKVPRHLFVPEQRREEAYEDYPLPIGEGQTISQPYIVAVMSEAMKLKGKETVFEVGTGSGYQAAVLSLLCRKVYSIEIVTVLAGRARQLFKKLGYKNVTVVEGDGYAGLPDKAPFDAIMITAAPEVVPEPLKKQLKIGGRLVLPLGKHFQDLVRVVRTGENEWKQEVVLPSVIFVPMTGKVQEY